MNIIDSLNRIVEKRNKYKETAYFLLEGLFDYIKETLAGKVEKVVGTKSLVNHAVCLSAEGEVSLEMEKVLNAYPNNDNPLKAQKVLEINVNHAIFNKIKNLYNEDKEKLNSLIEVLYSTSLLVQGLEVENISETCDLIVNMLSM